MTTDGSYYSGLAEFSTIILRMPFRKMLDLGDRILISLEEGSERRFFLRVVAILLILYVPTASYTRPYHIDAFANVYTAWSLANEGTPYLDDWKPVTGPDYFSQANQIVEGKGRPVSKYPPGAALLAAPLYLFFPDAPVVVGKYLTFDDEVRTSTDPVPSLVPAAIVAVSTTAIGVAAIGLLIRRRWGGRVALVAFLALGLGTTLWAIAANALWQHGPATMWMGLGLLALDTRRHALGGLSFGLAILTRPQIALAVAVIGVGISIGRRSFKTLAVIGVTSGMGMLLYLVYNLAVFGEMIPHAAGGYWIENTATASFALTEGLWRTFLDPSRGVLLWSPVTLPSLLRLKTAWRTTDPLVRSSAVGSVAYLLFQLRGNTWTGGSGFFTYRYAIEPLFLATPLLVASAISWTGSRPIRRWILGFAILASIAIQLAGAIIY